MIPRVTATSLRPVPALYPVLLEQTAHYGDLDPSRRIGRDALVRWFENARLAVEREAFGAEVRSNLRLMLASVRVDVLEPLRVSPAAGPPGGVRIDTSRYHVGVGVTAVGRSSFTYSYAVFAGDDCVAVGESVSVHVTADGSTPLPGPVRDALDGLRMDVPAADRSGRAAGRLVRERYPFRLDIRTRFGDLDTNRHINNVALAGWYLDALAELHLDVLGYPVGGPLDGLAPSSLHVDYLHEVAYPGIYQLRVGVVELDEESVRYACGLFDGPRCIGLADAVGAHRSAAPDGDPVVSAAGFESFRMR